MTLSSLAAVLRLLLSMKTFIAKKGINMSMVAIVAVSPACKINDVVDIQVLTKVPS